MCYSTFSFTVRAKSYTWEKQSHSFNVISRLTANLGNCEFLYFLRFENFYYTFRIMSPKGGWVFFTYLFPVLQYSSFRLYDYIVKQGLVLILNKKGNSANILLIVCSDVSLVFINDGYICYRILNHGQKYRIERAWIDHFEMVKNIDKDGQ